MNTIKSRTIGVIITGPRNLRGQHNYMSLKLGQKIDGRVVSVLPVTDAVNKRIEDLGSDQGQLCSQ